MLLKILFTLACFFLVSNTARSQYLLVIEVSGLKNDKGAVLLQLFNKNKEVIDQSKGIIRDKKCSITFHELKPGKYGIRFYHDENSSGKMETNLFGKPVEGYGFSNNVTGKFGPPPFEKWLFDLRENKKIIINTIY